MFGKNVRVILKGQARESYLELKKREDKEAKTLLNSIERAISLLKENPQFGNPIKKELIPEEFKKLGIMNLYRMELSFFWRMLYSLEGNKIDIFVFILSIEDHKKYNKRFGYK